MNCFVETLDSKIFARVLFSRNFAYTQHALHVHTKNSMYDKEIPQSQTADKPMEPWARATQQSRDTMKTN